MEDMSHYERLGVDETASFEEIQAAKVRLAQEHKGDSRTLEAIEASYDAILMDRLRQRQEGKIKVPDRIRFPERTAEPPPDFAPAAPNASPSWLQQWIDTPSRADILWPGGLLLGAGLLGLGSPSLALALGVGISIFFLNRKEHKFGRAFLLSLAGLLLGVLLGTALAGAIAPQLAQINLGVSSAAAIVALFILWLISSFLR